jgi:hypothetical protein
MPATRIALAMRCITALQTRLAERALTTGLIARRARTERALATRARRAAVSAFAGTERLLPEGAIPLGAFAARRTIREIAILPVAVEARRIATIPETAVTRLSERALAAGFIARRARAEGAITAFTRRAAFASFETGFAGRTIALGAILARRPRAIRPVTIPGTLAGAFRETGPGAITGAGPFGAEAAVARLASAFFVCIALCHRILVSEGRGLSEGREGLLFKGLTCSGRAA